MDLKSQLIKIKEASPELIYLVCFPKECAVALKQISELKIRSKILGADAADDSSAYITLKDSANGFTILVLGSGNKEFAEKYKARFGREPGAYAEQSFDAVNLLINAVKSEGTDGEQIKNYLYSVNFDGVSGKIQFDKFGDIISAKYDLKVWNNNAFELLDQISN